MKASVIYLTITFLVFITCYSCKKEFSCEGCRDRNFPPKAVAGPDQVITLPLDSVFLDGSASSDSNGSLIKFRWTKISGPPAFNMTSPTDSITRIQSLVNGIYQFELTVTDNGGLSSKDTVQVTVNNIGQNNRPPIANAGPDKVVSDSLTLDGSGSTDPDNNIISYLWTKISGPSSSPFSNPNAVEIHISNLIEGVYHFELKVTDAGGLFSADTVQVKVTGGLVNVPCDNSTRPLIDAQMLPVTSLPLGSGSDFVVKDNKLYFLTIECPNCIRETKKLAYYNIYDLHTQTWTKSSEYLITPRRYGATIIAAGDLIFYAGGAQSDPPNYFEILSDVDIYDVRNNTWSSTYLSEGRINIAGAVVGNKVLLAGGFREDLVNKAKPSTTIDIFDLTTLTWSIASLSQSRADISAVTANGKVYFAGGSAGLYAISGGLGATDVIDIYDYTSNSWSVSTLAEPKTMMSGIFVGNKIFWAGGLGPGEEWEADVEIRDLNTQSTFQACLNNEKYWNHGKKGAALIDNKIVFFTGIAVSTVVYNTRFDIYDLNSNTWLVGKLPFDIGDASIFSYNNTIYVVGGRVKGEPSTQIWKLLF